MNQRRSQILQLPTGKYLRRIDCRYFVYRASALFGVGLERRLLSQVGGHCAAPGSRLQCTLSLQCSFDREGRSAVMYARIQGPSSQTSLLPYRPCPPCRFGADYSETWAAGTLAISTCSLGNRSVSRFDRFQLGSAHSARSRIPLSSPVLVSHLLRFQGSAFASPPNRQMRMRFGALLCSVTSSNWHTPTISQKLSSFASCLDTCGEAA